MAVKRFKFSVREHQLWFLSLTVGLGSHPLVIALSAKSIEPHTLTASALGGGLLMSTYKFTGLANSYSKDVSGLTPLTESILPHKDGREE